MKAYISKLEGGIFRLIPKIIKQKNNYIFIQWGRRELVINTGKEVQDPDLEITFRPTPIDPNIGVVMPMLDFLEAARTGFISEADGILYFADIRFTSNIKVDFNNLKNQAIDFLSRKKEGRWYPTHVVWFND